MALSNHLENALLDHVLRGNAYTAPGSIHVALFTTDPTDADTGTEVAGNAYARQTVTFDAPSGGATANSGVVQFAVATGSWGTVTHIGLYDASTGGNLLFHGALTQSRAIGENDQFRIPAGDLTVELD
jgi:hypothetical protein